MNVLGHEYFGYLEKKWKLFGRKLPNIMYYTEFYKSILRHVDAIILFLYLKQELHSDVP